MQPSWMSAAVCPHMKRRDKLLGEPPQDDVREEPAHDDLFGETATPALYRLIISSFDFGDNGSSGDDDAKTITEQSG